MPTVTSGGAPLRSASAIVAGTKSGQHLLMIAGYSRITKDVPTGSHITSRSFHGGGHSWHIIYYPNGLNSTWSDYISIYLQLDYDVTQGVKAQYTFSLLDHGGKPVRTITSGDVKIFRQEGWGTAGFIKREELEKSNKNLIRDDSFTIRCEFTVIKEIQTEHIDVDAATPHQPPPAVVVPPSELHRHLGGLLATGDGADVTFEVDGKTFPAHQLVLAARSPVLHAELSALRANKESAATDGGGAAVVRVVEDMEAQDFEAFLHYVYTDTLPKMKGNDAAAMLPDLVAAANRYKMERLRLVCEDKLCELVTVRTVAAIIAFAGEHHCHGLKGACLRFLEDPGNLREVVKVNGVELLSESCSSVLRDLIAKLVSGLQSSNA